MSSKPSFQRNRNLRPKLEKIPGDLRDAWHQDRSPEDLEAFLGKLESDGHFAMDFWAFAGKLSAREGGELSDDQMLALFVEGVIGSPLPQRATPLWTPLWPFSAPCSRAWMFTRPSLRLLPLRRAPPRLRPSTKQDPGSPPPRTQGQNGSPQASLPCPQPAEPEPIPLICHPNCSLPCKASRLVSRDLEPPIGKIDQRLSGLETKVKKQASQNEAIAPLLRTPVVKPWKDHSFR